MQHATHQIEQQQSVHPPVRTDSGIQYSSIAAKRRSAKRASNTYIVNNPVQHPLAQRLICCYILHCSIKNSGEKQITTCLVFVCTKCMLAGATRRLLSTLAHTHTYTHIQQHTIHSKCLYRAFGVCVSIAASLTGIGDCAVSTPAGKTTSVCRCAQFNHTNTRIQTAEPSTPSHSCVRAVSVCLDRLCGDTIHCGPER